MKYLKEVEYEKYKKIMDPYELFGIKENRLEVAIGISEISRRLLKEQEIKGMSNEEFARFIDISDEAMIKITKFKYIPTLKRLFEIAKKLELDIDINFNKKINRYYDENSDEYVKQTLNLEMEDQRNVLLKHLKEGMHIIDVGCGSGRDSKEFISKGFKVTMLDSSKKMCEAAEKLNGFKAVHGDLSDINLMYWYDAAWCSASLVHSYFNELAFVIQRIIRSLKEGGYFYASFKYGDFEGMRGERYYTDINEERLNLLLSRIKQIELVETSIATVVDLDGDRDQTWISFILKKVI